MYKLTFIILIFLAAITASAEDLYLEESDYYEKDDKYIETESFKEGLDIICLPESRDIYINKRFSGTSPMALDLEAGSYKLTLMQKSQVFEEMWITIQEDNRLIKVFDNRTLDIEPEHENNSSGNTEIKTGTQNLNYRIDSSLYIPDKTIEKLTLGSSFVLYYKNRVAVHLAAEKELWSETEASENLKKWETGFLLNKQPLTKEKSIYLNGHLILENNDDYFLSARLSPEISKGFLSLGLFTEFNVNLNECSLSVPSGLLLKITSRYFLLKSESAWNDGFSQKLKLILNQQSVFRPYAVIEYSESQTLAGAGFQLGF